MYDNLIGIHYRSGVISPQWMPNTKLDGIHLNFSESWYQWNGISYRDPPHQITINTRMYYERAALYGLSEADQIYAFGSTGVELLFTQKYYRSGTIIEEGF